MWHYFDGLPWIGIYFAICASCALLLRFTVRIPDEIFRKLLHCILLGSLGVWVLVSSQWWVAASTALLFAIAVYPILCLAERLRGYSQAVTERKKGELKASLLEVFSMFAIVVTVCWGLFSDRYLVLASVWAWGFGDAAAALIGKRFGTHKIPKPIADGRKTVEGTAAMFLFAFLSVLIILGLRGGLGTAGTVLTALVTAAVAAAAELLTKNGRDTVTCPLAAMGALLLCLFLGGAL